MQDIKFQKVCNLFNLKSTLIQFPPRTAALLDQHHAGTLKKLAQTKKYFILGISYDMNNMISNKLN